MMKRVVAAVAGIGAVVVPLAVAAPASASTTTFAVVVGPVKINRTDHTKASVPVLYRCTTADHTSPHSFVSAKQVGSRKPDPALKEAGSSGVAIGTGGVWAMSHRNAMNCDSRVHLSTFAIDQVETSGFGVPVRPFATGWSWVQFCIFDDNYPLPPPGTPDDEGAPLDATGFRFTL